jgi:hypothetical protein
VPATHHQGHEGGDRVDAGQREAPAGSKTAVFRRAKVHEGAKPALNSAKVPPTRGSRNQEWRNVRLRRKWKP